MYRTSFLFGPKFVLRNLKAKKRRLIVYTYLGSVSFSFVMIFLSDSTAVKLLILVSCLVQLVAYWWYTISFIPYGRKILKCCAKWLCEGVDDI